MAPFLCLDGLVSKINPPKKPPPPDEPTKAPHVIFLGLTREVWPDLVSSTHLSNSIASVQSSLKTAPAHRWVLEGGLIKDTTNQPFETLWGDVGSMPRNKLVSSSKINGAGLNRLSRYLLPWDQKLELGPFDQNFWVNHKVLRALGKCQTDIGSQVSRNMQDFLKI